MNPAATQTEPSAAAGVRQTGHLGHARETFARCLRDAHAMERQSESLLSGALGRVENYPMVEEMLQQHLKETGEQIERLDRILERVGEHPSAMKDATGGVSGLLGGFSAAMTSDEILKNGLALYAFENFEAAAYEQLVVMAQMAGADEAVPPLKESLAEERAMASRVGASGRPLVHRFLELSSDASRRASR